jgi:magnesium-transporting ATPase (P-type)
MTDHPLPPPLPKKNRPVFKTRSAALFSSSIAIFVTAATVCYVTLELAGVSFPSEKFPPLYGHTLYAFIGACAVTLAHLILRPLFFRIKLIKTYYITVFANASLWFGITCSILNALRERVTPADAIYLAGTGVLTFFGGILLCAFAVRRVARLSKSAEDPLSKARRF